MPDSPLLNVVTRILSGDLVRTATVRPQADSPPSAPASLDESDEPLTGVCRDAVQGMRALTADLDVPGHLQMGSAGRRHTDFDVRRYFSVLNHLSMQEGWVLDYVYLYEHLGGRPILYARPLVQAPCVTFDDFRAVYGQDEKVWPNYLDHVVVDDTAAGYLQRVVLNVMGGQFYLRWHAAYDDHRIIYDWDCLNALVAVPNPCGVLAEAVEAARTLDLTPRVRLGEDEARVTVVVFTQWGGFYRLAAAIGRKPPHATALELTKLVSYYCGIVF